MLLIFTLLGCPRHAIEAQDTGVVVFRDRAIALSPYLKGHPYSGYIPVFETGMLFYDRSAEQKTLQAIPMQLESPPTLSAGKTISAVDWNTRTRWGTEYHGEALWFSGDERNDERINLYRIDPASGTLTALTDESYVYGWSFDDADSELVIIPRRGEGPYTSCLERMRPDGSERTEVLCDTPALSLTWDTPSWAPDKRGVLVRVNIDGERKRKNLAWVSFDNPGLQIITDPGLTRTSVSSLRPWLDTHRFLYLDDSSGFEQLVRYDLRTGEKTVLSSFSRSTVEGVVLQRDQKSRVLLHQQRPDTATLVLMDPETGNILDEEVIAGQVSLLGDDSESRVLVAVSTGATPFESLALTVTDTIEMAPWLATPAPLAETLSQCTVAPVSFETHDGRTISALLYEPREGLAKKTARITAFYGGTNRYRPETHIFCEAGIATLSPAVRGSRGYGAAFYQLNDGDLGGDEIADLFAGARFLEGRGYEAIGLHGGSHGGYATMRAMTFPPGTNGHEDVYTFAFGMAHAGFSDILSFYETCNIPDWVVLEAGDPSSEAEKLRDRSPLTHASRLSAPLLLTHGENDSRVPVEESRQMAAACDALEKSCTYVEFAGQGHRIEGIANQTRLFQARFSFLEGALK